MCSRHPPTTPTHPLDPSNLMPTLHHEMRRIESRRDTLTALINQSMSIGLSSPDRSIAQETAYMEALALLSQVATLVRDFANTFAGDVVPLMEHMGYDFEASERLLGWDRERWRGYFRGLRAHFGAQVEGFEAHGRWVEEEIERINEGGVRRVHGVRGEEGRLAAEVDEVEIEEWREKEREEDKVDGSSNAVAEFWAMVEGMGLHDDEDG